MDSKPDDAAPLLWRTRATTLALARALNTSLLLLGGSGLALWLGRAHANLVQWLLLLHLATALLALLFALPFVIVHLKDGREPLRRLLWPWALWRGAWRGGFERRLLVGHGLLWLLVLLVLSGLVVALPGLGVLAGRPWIWPLGTQSWLLDLHRGLTPLLLLALLWHVGRHRRWPARLLGGTLATAALLGAAAGWLPAPTPLPVPVPQGMPLYSLPFGEDPFAPGAWRTPEQALVNWRAVSSASSCGSCHRREFMEWNSSLHAISDRDLLYDAAVQTNVTQTQAARRHGEEKGRWCESCHNPLGTLTGAVTPLRSVQETTALEEGVSCVVCHTASHARPQQGNGALQSNLDAVLHPRHSALLAAAPARHARDMQAAREAPLMRESALCGACHTEIRPTTVAGSAPMTFQDTYEEWRRSDYARRGVQCQHCHMAAYPVAAIAQLQRGAPGRVRVSHRMPGANHLLADPSLPATLLHALRGGSPVGLNRQFDDAEFATELQRTRDQALGLLRAAARLELQWLPAPGQAATLRVGVRNVGAGHALPTGPLDQRQMWLEVQVRDERGRLLLHRGAFDARRGRVDPQAVIWSKRMFDAQGQLDLRHLLFDVQRLDYTRPPIPAGAVQQIDFALPAPLPPGTRLQAQVRLWYRLAHQELLRNIEVTGAPVPEIIVPPVLMTEAALAQELPS